MTGGAGEDAIPLFARAPKGMVAQLVEFLDEDGDGECAQDRSAHVVMILVLCAGEMDVDEVKVLFSKLSGEPIENIPDDHAEVQALFSVRLVDSGCDLLVLCSAIPISAPRSW